MSRKNDGLGFFGRKKKAFDELTLSDRIRQNNEYVLIRKTRMKAERDYFASEGDSDPERLEAQKARDQEFINSLKKVAIGFIIFLIFYVLLKTVLGLW